MANAQAPIAPSEAPARGAPAYRGRTDAQSRKVERLPVRAVQRAFDLLALIGTSRSRATLSELARGSTLAVSTVARLLATLEQAGFVHRDAEGRFRAGARLLQVGLAAVRGSTLYELSESYLRELSEVSGETANLAVRIDTRHAIYLRQVVSPRSIHHASWLGRTLPLEKTAIGHALLGRTSPRGFIALRDTLEPDVTAVAAPLYSSAGEIAAAFSITGPSFRISELDVDRFGALVVEAGRRASTDLGSSIHR